MEISFLNQLIMGFIQGIFEWLPISSSAFILLFANNFLNITNLGELIRLALFFHIGTFLAALIYFRKDVKKLIQTLFQYRKQNIEERNLFNFILISFLISAILGYILYHLINITSKNLIITGKTINVIIVALLLVTAITGLLSKTKGNKKEKDLGFKDILILGVSQGLSIIPGISRSGITVSSLLLMNFNKTTALKLSFLMSLPMVLVGNILLNFSHFGGPLPWIGVLSAFVFGILTIHILMKISKKINFNWFLLIFAILIGISLIF